MIAEPSVFPLELLEVAEIIKVFPLGVIVTFGPADRPTVPDSPLSVKTAWVRPEVAAVEIVNVLPLLLSVIPEPAEIPTIPVSPLIEFTASNDPVWPFKDDTLSRLPVNPFSESTPLFVMDTSVDVPVS